MNDLATVTRSAGQADGGVGGFAVDGEPSLLLVFADEMDAATSHPLLVALSS